MKGRLMSVERTEVNRELTWNSHFRFYPRKGRKRWDCNNEANIESWLQWWIKITRGAKINWTDWGLVSIMKITNTKRIDCKSCEWF